ncbi:serine/threonine-protein kinase [Pedococcus sp. KACC 23699]|uniref:non-specific serine/threonine protein kinase n=1 Tax=Pedococcus sp. KACC 23699 TaxID=3149228 RepID=A0AAU7JYZ2_9MICO
MTLSQGDVLADRYRLEESIAMGGMGEVWRAHDRVLDRDVAVKVLRPDSASDDAFAERFRAEARHSGGLSHPNIGTVHDFGEDQGTAFLVMELLAGDPLSTLIRERAPMPQQEVSDILLQAALALQAAHEAGVVHRDVKPANIVVDPEGYAKLTDFGIARALSEAPMTQTGEVLGTPHYLAPEQAAGRPAGPLSDVYALAVVGYEMLTGQRPFNGESMVTTALAHLSQPAPQLSDEVEEPLRTTVMAALAKDPAQRPASAAEFAAALQLPKGEVPEHLRAGAASAVTPVIAGVPEGLRADETLPTSVFLAPVVGAGAGAGSSAGPAGSAEQTTVHDTRRRPTWALPVAACTAVLLAVALVIVMTSRSPASTLPRPAPTTTPVAATLPTTAKASTRTTMTPATSTTAPRTTPRTTTSVVKHSAAPAKPAPAPVHAGKPKGHGKGKGKKP